MTFANNIKKVYLHYTIKQNPITKKCKVYRHFLDSELSNKSKEVHKKQLVKNSKGITKREAENLIYLLTK